MAEYLGREVQVERHLHTNELEKVIILNKDGSIQAVPLKDVNLTDEEQKTYLDHHQKHMDEKLAPWEAKRKSKKNKSKVEVKEPEAPRVLSNTEVPKRVTIDSPTKFKAL